MHLVYAILSTISIGSGEFFAGAATERTRAHEVTSTMFLSGVAFMAVVAIVWPGDPTTADMLYGALAGVANGVGILLLYWSYANASVRSAAPAAAIVMSSVPVLWDIVVSGRTPSMIIGIGLLLGVIAIGLSSYERDEQPTDPRGLYAAILAGAVFGVLLIIFSYIGDDAGGPPLFVQRVVGFVVAIAVTRMTGPRIFPKDRGDFAIGLLVGILATLAVLLFALALRGGSLSIVSVVSSQYASVAVLLGVAFRGQRMWWWQALGLAGASVSVALIAIG